MPPYSMDLRARVLKACDGGQGTAAVARTFSVSASWVRRLKQRRREDGRIEPKPPRNNRVPKLAPHADRIRGLLAATPDMTLAELRDALSVRVSLATVWAAVRALGFTFKKSRAGRRARPRRRAGGPRTLAAGGDPGPRPGPGSVRR